jgi:hypothetical protein
MAVYVVVGAFVVFILLAMVFGRGRGRNDSNTWDAGGDSGGGSHEHHGCSGGSGGGGGCGGGGGD